MKSLSKMKLFAVVMLLSATTQSLLAQSKTKADIFNESTPITWLGLDFTQTKFIGNAAQFKEAGEITSNEFRDKYTVSWNELFVKEYKKYNVAEAVHRSSVTMAVEVAEKANANIKKDFFSQNITDYKTLTEENIAALVKKYDFQKHDGIGLIFFVEGMSKAKEQSGAWVTFVDMNTKQVLLTVYETGSTGGFGFRNYWAKSFLKILDAAGDGYKQWKKS